MKRTYAAPSLLKGVTLKACSAEVRAPVSILALMRLTPKSGSRTHSRQPMRFFLALRRRQHASSAAASIASFFGLMDVWRGFFDLVLRRLVSRGDAIDLKNPDLDAAQHAAAESQPLPAASR